MAEFNLWDIESGSFIGKYADERAALATVKKLIDQYGPSYADDLSLGRVADDGRILSPLSGADLVGKLNVTDAERPSEFYGSAARRANSTHEIAAGSARKAAPLAGQHVDRSSDGAVRRPAAPKRVHRKAE